MPTVHTQAALALIVCAFLTTELLAQEAAVDPTPRFLFQDRELLEPTRFGVGAAFLVSEPKEEFSNNVGLGFGIGGGMQYRVDRTGWFSVRLDASWLRYGHETKRVPFSQTVGGRILVDVSTSNSILGFGIGPEVSVPFGPIRPYLNAGFSGLLFRTTSSVSGIDSSDEPIAGTTNLSDWTSAWVAGTGIRIPLGRDSPASLDLGLRYHRGGEALYLREGSIVDNPGGSVTINPLNSETPFMIYAVGIRFRIPWGSSEPCPAWIC